MHINIAHLLFAILFFRLHDLEEVVGSNERLNQHIQQKEERISVLQTRYF